MSTLAYISTPPPTPHQLAIAHLASRLFPPREADPVEVDTWFNKNAKYHNAMLRLVSREALFVSSVTDDIILATHSTLNKSYRALNPPLSEL
jgi:hypothetical protein